LLDLLADDDFQTAVSDLPGYDVSEMGAVTFLSAAGEVREVTEVTG
jgi:hypothetical protein